MRRIPVKIILIEGFETIAERLFLSKRVKTLLKMASVGEIHPNPLPLIFDWTVNKKQQLKWKRVF